MNSVISNSPLSNRCAGRKQNLVGVELTKQNLMGLGCVIVIISFRVPLTAINSIKISISLGLTAWFDIFMVPAPRQKGERSGRQA